LDKVRGEKEKFCRDAVCLAKSFSPVPANYKAFALVICAAAAFLDVEERNSLVGGGAIMNELADFLTDGDYSKALKERDLAIEYDMALKKALAEERALKEKTLAETKALAAENKALEKKALAERKALERKALAEKKALEKKALAAEKALAKEKEKYKADIKTIVLKMKSKNVDVADICRLIGVNENQVNEILS
jgi:hypothetical protein